MYTCVYIVVSPFVRPSVAWRFACQPCSENRRTATGRKGTGGYHRRREDGYSTGAWYRRAAAPAVFLLLIETQKKINYTSTRCTPPSARCRPVLLLLVGYRNQFIRHTSDTHTHTHTHLAYTPKETRPSRRTLGQVFLETTARKCESCRQSRPRPRHSSNRCLDHRRSRAG